MQREWTKRQLKGLQKGRERDYLKDKEKKKKRREEKAARKTEQRQKPRRLEIKETWEQEVREQSDDR